RRMLKKMNEINIAMGRVEEEGGILKPVKKAWLGARAFACFARAYMIPSQKNTIPATSRLHPVW
ncbi:MAG: magnesium-protoporphyrin IX monomethyl ester (oxidative) cyclase, partial [Pseudomonadota bacterium]